MAMYDIYEYMIRACMSAHLNSYTPTQRHTLLHAHMSHTAFAILAYGNSPIEVDALHLQRAIASPQHASTC
jgi:hypothetical protein